MSHQQGGFLGRLKRLVTGGGPEGRLRVQMQFQARMFADSYNVGYAMEAEQRKADGLPVRPFDSSPASLGEVDALVLGLLHGDPGTREAVDQGLFVTGAGAYYGEVIVRHLGGQWEARSPEGAAPTGGQAIQAGALQVSGIGGGDVAERPLLRVLERVNSQDAPSLQSAFEDLKRRSGAGPAT